MSDELLKEKHFEEAIEAFLTSADGGYQKGDPNSLNRVTALDEKTLIEFVKASQPKAWEKHCFNYPDEPEKAFINRFSKEVADTNLLQVLRHGFKDRGVQFSVCYFKPETSLNPDNVALYEQNILHCIRQMKFSLFDERSIDIVLLLNGIPVVSIELKNQFTGQDTTNAINQYKFDRATKDKLFEFKQRTLVHFAVDLYNVFMTTRISGAGTYFLPFNQGSNGAGNVGGKGNPIVEDDFATAYLWKKVLKKEVLLEILKKYMHLKIENVKDKEGKIVAKKEVMIFPRYHQLDVVSRLLDDVKQNGAGKNYLIQHSAGSGKSNSIAWLAHRLSSLHKDDEIIFNSVIVVTDRKVLDSQLQDTIYQFDQVDGVVRPIKEGSDSLKTAINDGAKIIITTLQKFPFIYKEVESTSKRFAVIVDEAHSSQTGTAAKKLKEALGDSEKILEEFAKEEAIEESTQEDAEDKLIKELSTHGKHPNLSFFAFTATPKNKTLQVFGEKQEDGKYRAFHIYSMRQAIEEGFILDVLKNYTTYKRYYKIAKKIEGDPEYDKIKAARAVSRFESLHPHNIAQKTQIMVEHFRDITKQKIEGRAKAMIVTASRLHAVRYLFEFKRYIEEQGYKDLDVLVAFSGSLKDNNEEWTEEKINKNKGGKAIKETQLKDYFHTDDFNMLIVAEKYQTGFDEPLLHTMFVDKKLNGVKAVQTLSRLNRTMRGKDDTFVLDFANTQEEILQSFQPYYEATVLESETDPNLIYTQKRTLDDYRVYQSYEIENFAKKFYQKTVPTLDVLSPILMPAIQRYEVLEDKQKDEFKSALYAFVRTYAFIIQVCRMFDKDMQKFYIFAKYLLKILPRENSDKVNLNDELLLEYYKLQKTSDGAINLEPKGGVEIPPVDGSSGGGIEKEEDSLSEIIKKFNDKFNTEFTEQDKVLAQLKADIVRNPQMVNTAQSGDKTAFKTLYEKEFEQIAVERYEQNDSFFKELFENADRLKFIKELLLADIYNELRKKGK